MNPGDPSESQHDHWWQGRVDERLTEIGRRLQHMEVESESTGKVLVAVGSQLTDHSRRLADVEEKAQLASDAATRVLVEIAKLSTKVGLLIGVCTAVGGGLVAVGVYVVTNFPH